MYRWKLRLRKAYCWLNLHETSRFGNHVLANPSIFPQSGGTCRSRTRAWLDIVVTWTGNDGRGRECTPLKEARGRWSGNHGQQVVETLVKKSTSTKGRRGFIVRFTNVS